MDSFILSSQSVLLQSILIHIWAQLLVLTILQATVSIQAPVNKGGNSRFTI